MTLWIRRKNVCSQAFDLEKAEVVIVFVYVEPGPIQKLTTFITGLALLFFFSFLNLFLALLNIKKNWWDEAFVLHL